MQPLLAISVHDIDAGGLARSFELPLAWLTHALEDTDVSATGPGKADVRLSKTGHDVIVRGKVTAPLVMPCARCLTEVVLPIDGELSLLLRPSKIEHAPHTHGAHGHTAHGSHASHSTHPPHTYGTHAHSIHDALKPDAPAAKAPKDPEKEAAKAAKEAAKAARDAAKAAKVAKDPTKNGASRKRHDEEDEYEFSADEADTDHYDGETVVLDPFVREALLLEAPSFPLCSEDCPGIRPTAKAAPERSEPVLDPRLSPLRALKTKLMLAATPKDAAAPPGSEGSDPEGAPERPAPHAKAARPKMQSHRTPAVAKGAQAKTRAKHSPKKRAK